MKKCLLFKGSRGKKKKNGRKEEIKMGPGQFGKRPIR